MANTLDFTFRGKDKTQSAFSSLNRSISKTQITFDKLKGAMGAIAGVTAVAVLADFAKDLSKTADRIGKVASKLGISTSALQKFQFSAEQSGVSTETLNMAFQRFTRRIADARDGTGTALKAFNQMGISLSGAGGKAKSAEQLFMEVADVMKDIESETDKVSLAFKFFDSEGVSLVNMLQNGSGALKDYGNQLEDVGGIIDEKAIKATERFNDALNLLSKASRGIFSSLVLGIDDFIDRVPKALSKIQKFMGGEEFKIDFTKALGMSANELKQVFEDSTDELQRVDGILKNLRDTRKQMNKGEIFYKTILEEETKLNKQQYKLAEDREKLLTIISKKTGDLRDLTEETKDEQTDTNKLIRVENLGVEAVVKQKNIGKQLTEQTLEAIESTIKPTLILKELEEDTLDLYRQDVDEHKKINKELSEEEKRRKKIAKQNFEIGSAFIDGIKGASAQADRFFTAMGIQLKQVGDQMKLVFDTNWVAVVVKFAMSSKKVMGIVDKIFGTVGGAIDNIFEKLLPGLGDTNEMVLNTGNTIHEVLKTVEELSTEISDYNMTISGITDEAKELAQIEQSYQANRKKAEELDSGFLLYVADLTKQQALLARTTERVARATEAFKQSASSYITALETAGFTDLQKDLFLQAKGFITGPMKIFGDIIEGSKEILGIAEKRLPTAEAEKVTLQAFIDEKDFGKKKEMAKASDFLMSILGDQLAIIEKGVDKADFMEDVEVLGLKIGEKFDATGFIKATAKYQEAVLAFGKAIPDTAMGLLNDEIKALTDSISLQNGIVTTNTDLMDQASGGLFEMVKETIKSEFASGKSKEKILLDLDVVSSKLSEAGLSVDDLKTYIDGLKKFGDEIIEPNITYKKAIPETPPPTKPFSGNVDPSAGAYAMGGLVKRYPFGGKIYGPGHTSGGVNANLEGGEFVMSRSAVQKHGSDFMSAVNNGSMGGGVQVNIYDGTGQKITEFESGLRVEINQRANRYNEFPALAY